MVVIDLVEKVSAVADGMVARIPLPRADEMALARRWCELNGNTVTATGDGWIEVRRGRPRSAAASLPAQRRPGVRLWMYTNFDCNLSCSYCCVRSSPTATRRALGHERIARIAGEAAAAGVAELFLTGGEPFILADIGESIRACAEHLPTTVLTNGMLFGGRRYQTLCELPRERVVLQISLDSPSPDRHDRSRGQGTWKKAVEGIRTARRLGFRVRVAATVDALADRHGEANTRDFGLFLDDLGIAATDQLIRPLARRGRAIGGIELAPETTVPEITVTADGVYWHPVGADDPDMLVDREIFPVGERVTKVVALFEEHRRRLESAAAIFPCA